MTNALREQLAELAHDRWATWMSIMLAVCIHNPDGSATIPRELLDQWERRIAIPYSELSGAEQDGDRIEADKILESISGLELENGN